MFFRKLSLHMRFSQTLSLSLIMAILPLLLLFSIFTIFSDVKDLQSFLSKSDARLNTIRQQHSLAAEVQHTFQKQAQEWQYILLRGNDPGQFAQHVQSFTQAEQDTHATLVKLSTLSALPYDLAGTEITAAIKEHVRIGQIYRSSMQQERLMADHKYAFHIDADLGAVDQPLTGSLRVIKSLTEKQLMLATEGFKAHQTDDLATIQNHIRVTMAFMALLVLFAAVLSFRETSDSRTRLSLLLTENARKLRQLSESDALTCLPNRRVFQTQLQDVFDNMENGKVHYGLLLLDFDQFKTLNAAYGQAVGDMVLAEAARRIVRALKSTDFAARLGGDQFIIMTEKLSNDASESAHKARLAAGALHEVLKQPYTFSGSPLTLTASIGITLFNSTDAQTDDLLVQAESAVRHAKKTGRNQISFFDPVAQQKLLDQQQLEKELDIAIGLQQMELFYQLQVDAAGNATGAEALIRWRHPAKGMVSPADFIPAAEETGLILPMGQWVIDSACAQLQTWSKDPALCHLSIAVNVSARQFREKDFVLQVVNTVSHFGIDPTKLKLEITESMVLDNVESTIQTMLQLRSVGLRFSMDDFGTGYSSLSYLKRLPLDQLKIDQFFVRDLDTNKHDKAIVSTIISMAKNMQLDVIAEGVETVSQRDFLHAQGCVAYQGYYFARPLPILEMEALARQIGVAGHVAANAA
jgi:diguanylate cyclase (GGDEF)-like protein